MELKSFEEADVKGKRVILRAHFDVKFEESGGKRIVKDDARLIAAVPSIKTFLEKGAAKVVLMSWAQRPEGKVIQEMNLDPVGDRLSELLDRPVVKLDDCVGESTVSAIDSAENRTVILLENVRFHPGEKDTKTYDQEYARELAKNGDLFINDAFGQSHRDVASITGIPKFIPSYAGPRLIREVTELSHLLENPARPFVAVIGGAKISTKLGVIKLLLNKVDNLLLGGALANTILQAQGIQVGTSLIEEEMIDEAKELSLTDNRLHIPVDVVTAKEISDDAEINTKAVGSINEDEKILDIGPDTVKLFENVLQQAGTIMWNGPMGWFEIKKFGVGTDQIAKAITKSSAKTVIGGGETIASVRQLGLENDISFISMGGGAMLKFLETGTLVGIKPLIK